MYEYATCSQVGENQSVVCALPATSPCAKALSVSLSPPQNRMMCFSFYIYGLFQAWVKLLPQPIKPVNLVNPPLSPELEAVILIVSNLQYLIFFSLCVSQSHFNKDVNTVGLQKRVCFCSLSIDNKAVDMCFCVYFCC